jgi:thiol:disulfide interchange protein
MTESVSQTASATSSLYVPVTRFDPSRDAARDIADALTEARRSGRRVLLDVGGEWCIWCHRFDTLFVVHPDLAALMHAGFVVVKVNYSNENKNAEVLSRYPKVPGYPHLFVLEKDGTLLRSQNTGELESGRGHDPVKVRAFLQAWAPPKSGTPGGTERKK